jgi:hypothetical protein
MKTKLVNTSVIPAPVALLISAGLLLLVAGTQGSDPARGLERDNAGGGKLEGAWNVTVNICNNGPTGTGIRCSCLAPRARATRSGSRRLGSFDRRTLLLHYKILRP